MGERKPNDLGSHGKIYEVPQHVAGDPPEGTSLSEIGRQPAPLNYGTGATPALTKDYGK
jgi:hypothetical protein